jgi:hypothetical protein
MHDPLGIIRAYLLGSTESWGVFCPWLPDGLTNSSKTVVFRPQGGANAVYSPHSECSYLFSCFGGTRNVRDSWLVYASVFDRLIDARCETTTAGVLIRAYESNGGQALIDPDTEYRYVTATFEIATRGG